MIPAVCVFQYWKAVTQWSLEALQAMSSSKEELKTRTACSPETCFVHAMEEMRDLEEVGPVQESLATASHSKQWVFMVIKCLVVYEWAFLPSLCGRICQITCTIKKKKNPWVPNRLPYLVIYPWQYVQTVDLEYLFSTSKWEGQTEWHSHEFCRHLENLMWTEVMACASLWNQLGDGKRQEGEIEVTLRQPVHQSSGKKMASLVESLHLVLVSLSSLNHHICLTSIPHPHCVESWTPPPAPRFHGSQE